MQQHHDTEPTQLAIEAMVTRRIEMAKKNAKKQPVIQVKEPEPVIEAMPFKLYCGDVDEHGQFDPPDPLPDLMLQIEMLIESDQVSEYYQGAYACLVEILSCPVALMPDKIRDMLDEIHEEATDDESEDEPVSNDNKTHKVGFVPSTKDDKKAGEIANLTDNDISDEELLAEYEKASTRSEHLHDEY